MPQDAPSPAEIQAGSRLSKRFKGRISRYRGIAVIVAFAITIRLAFLAYLVKTPGFTWIDPDGYLFQAFSLIDSSGRWRWTMDAVRYSGPYIKAPLYQLLLSLFEYSPRGYGLTAAVTHALLAGLTVFALWSLVGDLHSRRAALVAAFAYAIYLPSLVSVNAIMQERLYVPLLVAGFALLSRSLRDVDRYWTLALSGMVLGLAALTRSMPVYFVGPGALLTAWMADTCPRGLKRAAAFLAGFGVIVVPYTLFISVELHRFVLIENIGAYGIARLDPQGQQFFPASAVEPPTMVQAAAYAGRRFFSDPVGFMGGKISGVTGTFRLGGGRWLDSHASLPTASSARLAKIAAHSLGDALFAIFALAAPFGFVAAKHRAIARMLALWVLVDLGMTAMAGYAGQRFREPIDWTLLAFGACLLAGAERRTTPRSLLVCVALCVLMARGMLPSIGPAIDSRADYGVGPWENTSGTRSASAEGAAGFKTGVINGRLDVLLKTRNPEKRVAVVLRVDGESTADAVIGAEGYRLRLPHVGTRAFVEVEGAARGGKTGLVIEAPSAGQTIP